MNIKKNRIAIFSTVTAFGGAEKVVLETIKQIDRKCFDLLPVIFTRRNTIDNLLVQSLKQLDQPFELILTDQAIIKYLSPLFNIIEAYRLVKQNRIQLIHSHGYRSDFIAAIVARLLGIPCISTCHGYIQTDQRLKLYRWVNSLTLRHFELIIAVSEAMAVQIKDAGIPKSKIVTIPNAVNSHMETANWKTVRANVRSKLNIDNCFVVGYLGRLSEEKGVHLLVEAAAGLMNNDKKVSLVIIGEGPAAERLELQIRKSRFADAFHLVGFQNRIEKWLPALDAFVLPSLTEGLPMALLEAMACGIPVVATRVGGVPTVIQDGHDGLLVEPENVDAITAALVAIIDDPGLGMSLGKNARRKINEKYSVNTWIRSIEKHYSAILSNSSAYKG